MARKLLVEIVGDASSLQKALGTASGHTQTFGSKLGTLAKTAGIAAGAAGLGGLLYTLKAGIGEWSEHQKVAAQTGAVLKSTGGAANVTAKQVEDLATSVMRKSGIDDEAVQSGENLLLTFTKVRNEAGRGNDIFNQATNIMADMSVAFGKDMSSSAIILGKALQDPVKGLTALRRIGVNTTELLPKIKALMGDTGKTAKEVAADQEKAAAGVERAQKAQETAARGVASAQDAVRAASEKLRDAQRDVVEATDKVKDAQHGVKESANKLKDAQDAVKDATRNVKDAHDKLKDAQDAAKRAQENLTEARKRAKDAIRDMKDALEGATLSEEGAALRLQSAQENLDKVMQDSTSTDLEKKQALLDVKQAEYDYEQAKKNTKKATEELTDAEKKGVEGSDDVIQAKKDIKAANDEVKDSSQGVKDAQDKLRQAHGRVKEAEYDLKEANDKVRDAQYELREAHERVADASNGVRDAQGKLVDAQANSRDASVKLKEAQAKLAEAQKETATQTVPTSNLLKAQKLILEELRKEVGGSAKALGDSLPGKINKAREAFKNWAGDMVDKVSPALGRAHDYIKALVSATKGAKGFRAKLNIVVGQVKLGAEVLANVLDKLISWVGKNARKFGEVGALILVNIFATLTDPSFWIKHWKLALVVAMTAFGGTLVKGFGLLAKTLASKFGIEFGEALLRAPDFVFSAGAVVEDIGRVFLGLGTKAKIAAAAAMTTAARAITDGVTEGVTAATDWGTKTAAGVLSGLTGGLTGIGTTVASAVTGAVSGAIGAGTQAFTDLYNAGDKLGGELVRGVTNAVTGIGKDVWGDLKGIGTTITNSLASVGNWGGKIAGAVKTGISTGLAGVGQWAWGIIDNIGGKIGEMAETILGWGSSIGNKIKTAVGNALSGIGKAAWNVIDNIGGFIGDQAETIMGWGKKIGHGIVAGIRWALAGMAKAVDVGEDIAKDIANAVIRLLNKVIKTLNDLLEFTIDTHIPGIGKVTINPKDIPSIPLLSKGGIVTAPTLAMIGERGPEAVVPLDRGGYGQPMTVNLNVDGTTLAKVLINPLRNEAQLIQLRTGQPAFG